LGLHTSEKNTLKAQNVEIHLNVERQEPYHDLVGCAVDKDSVIFLKKDSSFFVANLNEIEENGFVSSSKTACESFGETRIEKIKFFRKGFIVRSSDGFFSISSKGKEKIEFVRLKEGSEEFSVSNFGDAFVFVKGSEAQIFVGTDLLGPVATDLCEGNIETSAVERTGNQEVLLAVADKKTIRIYRAISSGVELEYQENLATSFHSFENKILNKIIFERDEKTLKVFLLGNDSNLRKLSFELKI